MSPRTRSAAEAALVFVACTVLFHAMLAHQPFVLDIDGMYHYRVAELIRERGPWVDISWLPFTVLREHGPDHEWLFHAILAPFTLLGRDLSALQWVSAMAGAAVPAALVPLLRGAGAPLAVLFSLAAAASTLLLPGRFLTLRTENLAVIFMAAALFALARRRTLALAVIGFLFMQSYHGAVILGPMAAIAMGVQALRERRVEVRPVVALAAGMFAGLLASPWFPENVRYLVFHTFFKAAIGVPGLAGTEWARLPLALLATQSWIAHLLVLSGLAAVAFAAARGRRPTLGEDTLAALALLAMLLAMTHFAWRFAEYSGPFGAICAALLWRDALAASGPPRRVAHLAAGAALALLVAIGLYRGNEAIQATQVEARTEFGAYREMMAYVESHDPAPMVFNARWSDFQHMVFWSDRARFVSGLDGHFLLYGDPARFKVWYDVESGATARTGGTARRIREAFGARWAIVSRELPAAQRALRADPQARLVMERPEGWLFELQPGL
jgi:hypothetical protein